MKIKLFFAWYDFWVGWYYDTKKDILYICPLPMIVLSFQFNCWYQIIGGYTGKVIGYTYGYDGKQSVLEYEPDSTFKRISKRQYIREHANE